nr:MAG TPA: hypothetical protein [Caudoviricetes sp.]
MQIAPERRRTPSFQNGQFCDGLKNVLFRYINILCIRSLYHKKTRGGGFLDRE